MKRRRWWLAGAAGVVAAISLLMVPALGDGPITTEVGVLRLHLDSDGDRLIFDPTAAGSNQTQTLTAPGCRLTSTGASLVSFAASATQTNKNPFPGLKDHRIGVGQTGEGNGEPCARIDKDLGQALTVGLTGALNGRAVSYAEIDLGFKFNSSATLQLFRSGVQVGSDITVPCSGASDCGPDSGASDNERVILFLSPLDDPPAGHWQEFQIEGVFDTIVIKPSDSVPAGKGVVSLEGGFNGSPAGPVGGLLGTDDTLFRVGDAFDGEIDCGEDETQSGEDATLNITRGFDTDGGCKGPTDGLLFNFEAGTEGNELFVDFITEPVGGASVAQFLEVITWEFDSPPDVSSGPQHRTLSYDDHVGDGKRVMPWCNSDPRVDTSGVLPAGNPADYLPLGHTSCLIESSSRVTGVLDILDYPLGTFLKVDIVYNIGDGKRYT
jgi:hypothetical protein